MGGCLLEVYIAKAFSNPLEAMLCVTTGLPPSAL